MPKKKTKGKEWRNKRMAAATPKVKERAPVYDPNISNKQRMEMKKAARIYRETGGL
jgi:hypothetical protein